MPASPKLTPASSPIWDPLPLSLVRHGAALISSGLVFGFVVPLATYPRLALTAHIQFAVQGTAVVAAGLLLNSTFAPAPTAPSPSRAGSEPGTGFPGQAATRLVDRLAAWQRKVVYWSIVGIWPMLLTEVGNAWWGTTGLLKIASEAAGLGGGKGPAAAWMEVVVELAHKACAVGLVFVWPIILYGLSMV
ncbi:hypothetical protein MFIFM68171_07155 [Madurella fahalii]|uniref:Uncharacterized protein n=1 Tax=Madurella fahalii TaxID=1157608 RepID=A0ABQ0GGY4_9PEZI